MIESLPLVLTGLGLAASIVYYANILNNANKTQQMQLETRQVQIFMRVIDRIWDADIQEAYEMILPSSMNVDEFFEKFREDIKFQRVFYRWAYYWENAGMLVKLGFLPIEFVTISPSVAINVVTSWENFRDVVYRFRESGRVKRNFAMWEHLYDELMKYYDEHPELAI